MAAVSRAGGRGRDQVIRIERLVQTGQNDTGSPAEEWQKLVRCWARVDGTRAAERYAGEGLRSVGDYTVWIDAGTFVQHRPTPKDRIVWESNRSLLLNILDAPDQQWRGQEIAIFANSGLNEG